MSTSWSDAYLVGHAEMDSQHRDMFALAELLITAKTQSGQLLCAKSLYEYTKDHFAHEEHLMTQSDYPDLHEHKRQHCRLLEMLDRISQDIEAGAVKLHDLKRLVNDWLVSHINTSDAKLSLFLGVEAEHGNRDSGHTGFVS